MSAVLHSESLVASGGWHNRLYNTRLKSPVIFKKWTHFDSQILAAAKRMGCATIFSEDLNHGQDYGGVRVVNPFRSE